LFLFYVKFRKKNKAWTHLAGPFLISTPYSLKGLDSFCWSSGFIICTSFYTCTPHSLKNDWTHLTSPAVLLFVRSLQSLVNAMESSPNACLSVHVMDNTTLHQSKREKLVLILSF